MDYWKNTETSWSGNLWKYHSVKYKVTKSNRGKYSNASKSDAMLRA